MNHSIAYCIHRTCVHVQSSFPSYLPLCVWVQLVSCGASVDVSIEQNSTVNIQVSCCHRIVSNLNTFDYSIHDRVQRVFVKASRKIVQEILEIPTGPRVSVSATNTHIALSVEVTILTL